MSRTTKKTIVTLAIGEKYLNNWKTYCKPTWEAYAAKYNYEIIVVDKPIKQLHEEKIRPLHWQKLFIFSHPEVSNYENVVFLDADIMINHHRAPCIVEANKRIDETRIGAVAFDRYLDDDLNAYIIGIRKGNFLTYEKRLELAKKEQGNPMRLPEVDFSKIYKEYTPDNKNIPRINSGVFVLKTSLHAEFWEGIYFSSLKEAKDNWVNGTEIDIDQSYIVYKLWQKQNYNLLDERFNTIAPFEHAIHYPFTYIITDEFLQKMCWSTMLANTYFLHFTRCASMMKYAIINENKDFAIVGLNDVFKNDIYTIKHRKTT
jgi:hypothetical protein